MQQKKHITYKQAFRKMGFNVSNRDDNYIYLSSELHGEARAIITRSAKGRKIKKRIICVTIGSKTYQSARDFLNSFRQKKTEDQLMIK